jgi:hypothetical protein
MSAYGASCSLPRVPAKVGLPKRERLLSVVGGNASSWPQSRPGAVQKDGSARNQFSRDGVLGWSSWIKLVTKVRLSSWPRLSRASRPHCESWAYTQAYLTSTNRAFRANAPRAHIFNATQVCGVSIARGAHRSF